MLLMCHYPRLRYAYRIPAACLGGPSKNSFLSGLSTTVCHVLCSSTTAWLMLGQTLWRLQPCAPNRGCWCSSFCPAPFCHAQLDDWVADFEAEEERKQRDKQSAMNEDGWTVVVRSKVGECMGLQV